MRNNDYTHNMTIWNARDYNAWIEIFRSDDSIENFEVKNKSVSGFEVEIRWNYKKNKK